ncbi:MAG: cytochrome ubiquinol oxidase subunit I [Deltaproteobacteria bacterium]|nr:cytochrome ubiquinol oxidase subunit I [Deltaproteobacteria bacterium]
MDVVFLSRLQFAVATLFHFFFVPLTIGLVIMIAIMETIYARRGDEEYRRMAKFWGKIFLINFAVGVVTGITLEFQFGTNWAGYSKYVGDIFGSLLAIEATATFFLESVFIGLWAFSWDKVSPKLHALFIWLVAAASTGSAYWILVANSWMQHPVGYVIRGGRAELVDFWAVITQPFAIVTFAHVVSAAYILAAFFVMGVCSYHILRKTHVAFATKSFRIAVTFALIFSLGNILIGDLHGKEMAKAQPTKLAAAEAQWETMKGAPFVLLRIPDEENERNPIDLIAIPKFLSWLALGSADAEFKGLKEWPKEERPPVALTFWSFRIMVGLGFLFALVSLIAFWKRNKLESAPWLLKGLMWMIPLPYLAASMGWLVTEVGRQPWIVYGVMKTSEAASEVAASQVGFSLAAFVVVYTLLGIACFTLIAKFVAQGPKAPPAEAK